MRRSLVIALTMLVLVACGGGEDQLTPAPVSGGISFVSISAGRAHTCGSTGSGSIYCWGDGLRGRLGNGEAIDRLVPTLVAPPPQ